MYMLVEYNSMYNYLSENDCIFENIANKGQNENGYGTGLIDFNYGLQISLIYLH